MSIDFDSLHSLPVAEKLQLVERLWDDIADSAGTAGLHEWHKDEINRRMAELEAAPESALTEEELWTRVEQRNA
jgi:putative addiction module component (TIGR02574 family)